MKPLAPQALGHFQAGWRAEQSGNWHAAVSAYTNCLEVAQPSYLLLCNLANALLMTEQLAAADQTLQQALLLAPEESKLWRLQATVQRDLNNLEAAEKAFQQAARRGVVDPISAWNHSETLMGLGRYREAFALAEQRLEEPSHQKLFHRPPPYWQGLTDASRLLIWSEQGLGDTLQFGRWLPLLQRQLPTECKVVVEVETPLVSLLQRGLSWLPKPPQVRPKQQPAAPHTGSQGSLLSLPHLLGGAPLPLPGPYLLDPAWQRRPRNNRRRPLVGVVWASGRRLEDANTARLYRRRSLPSEALCQLLSGLAAQGAELVNLQVGPDRAQAMEWQGSFADEMDPHADFAAMAECMATLDLTLSVDTAAAHLAGATGLPAWVLLPWNADGRWLRQRSDTPWYPSLRLWRQPEAGNWPGLVNNVLEGFAAWRVSG